MTTKFWTSNEAKGGSENGDCEAPAARGLGHCRAFQCVYCASPSIKQGSQPMAAGTAAPGAIMDELLLRLPLPLSLCSLSFLPQVTSKKLNVTRAIKPRNTIASHSSQKVNTKTTLENPNFCSAPIISPAQSSPKLADFDNHYIPKRRNTARVSWETGDKLSKYPQAPQVMRA